MLHRLIRLLIFVLGLAVAFSGVAAAQKNRVAVSANALNKLETLNFSSLAQAGGDAAMGISPAAFHGVGNSYSEAGFTFTATDNPWGPQTLGTWMDGSPNHPVGGRKATPLTAYYAGTKITATLNTGSFDLISVDLAQWAVNQGGGTGSFPVTFHGMRSGREVATQTFQVHRAPRSPLLSTYRFKGFTNLTSFYVIEEGTYATGYGFQLNNIVFRRNTASPTPSPAPPPQGPNSAVNPTHFHCYQVEGVTKPNRISLRDQFQTAPEVILGRPVMLCAPAQKNKEELKDTTTHLLCYQTVEGARPAAKRVVVKNQFGEQVLQVENSQLFCVPGLKQLPDSLTPQPPCLSSPPGPPGIRYGTRDLKLGGTLSAGVRQDVTLTVNTFEPRDAAQFQLDGGPISDAFEICVSTLPQDRGLPTSVAWTVEDPDDPTRKTLWATLFSGFFVEPLREGPKQTTVTTVLQGDVLKIDLSAKLVRDFLQTRLNPLMPGYPTGRVLLTIQLGSASYELAVAIGQK